MDINLAPACCGYGNSAKEVAMSTEENKTISRRLLEEVWNRGNLAVVDELVASDYVGHDVHTPGGAFYGPDGLKEHFAVLRAAIPDAHIAIEDAVAEGDRTVVRFTLSGTHGGSLMGIPPNGRSVRFSALLLSRFAGDRIVEEWGIAELLSLL
jgi:predicted ester cyclase